MGEASRRGTFKERQAKAIERDERIKAEADKLFAEWQRLQTSKVTPKDDTLVIEQ